ncbi:MAG: hypothetical protein QOF70_924 [Acetobacteraceae bacterium]|jgi:hypothetical protein|nr:hypothetical protein [Rhodopila sp.]MEA2726449.1 hypothetical protein [Acetobacteraceae bacterium]
MAVVVESFVFFLDFRLHLRVSREQHRNLTLSHLAEIVLVMLAAEGQYEPCIILALA